MFSELNNRYFTLFVLLGCSLVIAATGTISSSCDFSVQGYADQQIRKRFQESAPLHHLLIQEQNAGTIFDFQYDSGFRAVVMLDQGQSDIDILEYYEDGKRLHGNGECLCHIPEDIVHPVIDFTKDDITSLLIKLEEIDEDCEFINFYKEHNFYGIRFFSPANNYEVEFKIVLEADSYKILQKKIIQKATEYVEEEAIVALQQLDENAIDCLVYLQKTYTSFFNDCELLRVRKHSDHYAKYDFVVGLPFHHRNIQFFIVIEKTKTNQFLIVSEGYANQEETPTQFRIISNVENFQFKQINQKVISRLHNILTIDSILERVEAAQPYYRFTYLLQSTQTVTVTLLYDYLSGNVKIVQTDEAPLIKEHEIPSIVVTGSPQVQTHEVTEPQENQQIPQTSQFIVIDVNNKALMKYAFQALQIQSLQVNQIYPDFQVRDVEYSYVSGILIFRFIFVTSYRTFYRIYQYNLNTGQSHSLGEQPCQEEEKVTEDRDAEDGSIQLQPIDQGKIQLQPIQDGHLQLLDDQGLQLIDSQAGNGQIHLDESSTNIIEDPTQVNDQDPNEGVETAQVHENGNIQLIPRNGEQRECTLELPNYIDHHDIHHELIPQQLCLGNQQCLHSRPTIQQHYQRTPYQTIIEHPIEQQHSEEYSQNEELRHVCSHSQNEEPTQQSIELEPEDEGQEPPVQEYNQPSQENEDYVVPYNNEQQYTCTCHQLQPQLSNGWEPATQQSFDQHVPTAQESTSQAEDQSPPQDQGQQELQDEQVAQSQEVTEDEGQQNEQVAQDELIVEDEGQPTTQPQQTQQEPQDEQSQPQTQSNQPQSQQQSPPQQTHQLSVGEKSFIINSKQLSDITSITDAKLIPYLTGTTTTNHQQLTSIVNLIIDVHHIQCQIRILLINQINYAMRLVIELESDGSLYETVIDTIDMSILHWKQLYSINLITNNIFQNYYQIYQSASLHTLLKNILPFNSGIERIVNAKKKVGLDGIYYQVILRTKSTHAYRVLVYQIPQTKYHQVLLYSAIDVHYDKSKETSILSLDTDTRQFIKTKYGHILGQSEIKYIGSIHDQGNCYYRLIMEGDYGHYEIILLKNEQGYSVLKWEKLHNGYVQHYSQSVERLCAQRLSQVHITPTVRSMEYRVIPNYGTFYRIMYLKPFPFIVYVYESKYESQIVGVEEIVLPSTSKYYNDEDFSGFREIHQASLRYDIHYSHFADLLRQQIQTANVQAVFIKDEFDSILYKIIYDVHGQLFLAFFEYSYSDQKQYLKSFEEFELISRPGTYDWKCSKKNQEKGYCQICEGGYTGVLGRCYPQIQGCSVQFDKCYLCKDGYTRIQGKCLKHPTPQEQEEQATSHSTETQSRYDPAFDPNCLRYKGHECLKCAYRFYIKDGECAEVQNECARYNQRTGECLRCYNGFTLKDGVCIENQLRIDRGRYRQRYLDFIRFRDPFCVEIDQEGLCHQCRPGYDLRLGRCLPEW